MSKRWYIFRAAASQALAAREYAKAEALWYAALEEAEDYGEHSPRLTDTLEGLGEVEFRLEKYLNATAICKRLLRVYCEVLGPDHLNVGVISKNLAMLYECIGRKDDAVPLYENAVRLYKSHMGVEDPQVHAIAAAFSCLLLELGRSEEAINLQKDLDSTDYDSEEWRKSGTWRIDNVREQKTNP
ncbi:MAG TPA: tetratricopeptide repeat protein [Planktothrix sp.]